MNTEKPVEQSRVGVICGGGCKEISWGILLCERHAAASELLEAAKKALVALNRGAEGLDDTFCREERALLRAVIRKALGR